MLVVAGLILGQVKIFLVEVVANLALHLKRLELGQSVLRYSNPDRIMTCPDLQPKNSELEMGSGPPAPDTARK